MAPKPPTPQAISALLRKAGFARSEKLPRTARYDRYSAGFHVRGDSAAAYAGWRPETPLLSPSTTEADRNKATALEMAGKYADALTSAGWPAEVIHLAGPLVRVTAKPAETKEN
jgi:hypothetical protein